MSLQKWKPALRGVRADIYVPERMKNPILEAAMRYSGASSCPVFWAQYEGVYCELDHFLALLRLVKLAAEIDADLLLGDADGEKCRKFHHLIQEITERTDT